MAHIICECLKNKAPIRYSKNYMGRVLCSVNPYPVRIYGTHGTLEANQLVLNYPGYYTTIPIHQTQALQIKQNKININVCSIGC